jgi:hypothetical protein
MLFPHLQIKPMPVRERSDDSLSWHGGRTARLSITSPRLPSFPSPAQVAESRLNNYHSTWAGFLGDFHTGKGLVRTLVLFFGEIFLLFCVGVAEILVLIRSYRFFCN